MTVPITFPDGTEVFFSRRHFGGSVEYLLGNGYLDAWTQKYPSYDDYLANTAGSYECEWEGVMELRFLSNGEFSNLGINLPDARIAASFTSHSSLDKSAQFSGSLRYCGADFGLPIVLEYAYHAADGILYLFWEDTPRRFETAVRIGSHVALLLDGGERAVGWAVDELELLLPSSTTLSYDSDTLGTTRNLIDALLTFQRGEGYGAIDDREPRALEQLARTERIILQQWDKLPAANALFDAASEIRIATGLPAEFEKPVQRAP